MIKKIWVITHKAFEIFGWTFSDGVDVLELYLHRLPAKAAKVGGLHFRKKSLLLWNNAVRKNIYSSVQDI